MSTIFLPSFRRRRKRFNADATFESQSQGDFEAIARGHIPVTSYGDRSRPVHQVDKFYALWCGHGHCQARIPALKILGKEMRCALNIGVTSTQLISYRTDYYATTKDFQAADSDVKEIDLAGIEELESNGRDEVTSLFFYDDATTSEDFAALERLMLNMIGIVVQGGKPSFYTALSPRGMRDCDRTLEWMNSVSLPIVPELTAAKSHKIANRRMAVFRILPRNWPNSFAAVKKEASIH
ncbi:hypothetical protein RUND412_005094 [Rhizina undulata]